MGIEGGKLNRRDFLKRGVVTAGVGLTLGADKAEAGDVTGTPTREEFIKLVKERREREAKKREFA